MYFRTVKKALFIIALALFLKPLFPVIEYVINYEYIAKTLCVNKEKPQMQCNGKCHLMKELAKAAETEKPLSSNKKTNAKHLAEELFFQDLKALINQPIYTLHKKWVANNYSNLYDYKVNHFVFHPPAFIA